MDSFASYSGLFRSFNINRMHLYSNKRCYNRIILPSGSPSPSLLPHSQRSHFFFLKEPSLLSSPPRLPRAAISRRILQLWCFGVFSRYSCYLSSFACAPKSVRVTILAVGLFPIGGVLSSKVIVGLLQSFAYLPSVSYCLKISRSTLSTFSDLHRSPSA